VSEEEHKEEIIRVMLVDDHASFRQPLAFMLEQEPDLKVVAQAASLAQARKLLEEEEAELGEVDVAMVDLELPDGSGVEFITELHEVRPQTLA
jgi:DNA-binding NarL/FixJ family response regulator